MFIGSWKLNVTFGFIAFLFVFIGSLFTNIVFTSFIRGFFAFLLFYIVTYFFRWLWMLAFYENKGKTLEKAVLEGKEQGEANKEKKYTKENIDKASQYVKDLINN